MARTELAVACFRLGGHSAAIEASQVVRMLNNDDAELERYTGEDRDGVAETEQKIAGLSVDRDAPARILLLRQGRYLRVNAPVRLAQLPLQSIYPLPELVSARMQSRDIKAVSLDGERLILLIGL